MGAWLGSGGEDVLPPAGVAQGLGLEQARGVLVRSVDPGSPAAPGGERVRDVVVTLAGRAIASVADLQRGLSADAIGSTTTIEVVRAGRRESLGIRQMEPCRARVEDPRAATGSKPASRNAR